MMASERVSAAVVGLLSTTRGLRPSTRATERALRAGLRFRDDTASWSSDQKQAWMIDRLRAVVRQAAAETSFWRERCRQAAFNPRSDFTLDEFSRLPPLERGEVANHLPSMLSPRVPERERKRDATGGSSGVPLEYLSGPEERGWRLSGQEWYLRNVGVSPGTRTAFIWGHHIDQRERTDWRQRVRDTLTSRRWFDCFRLSADVLLAYHAELTRYRPSCVVAYASAIDALATVLLERGLDAAYPRDCIVTGAEKLWAHQRSRVERAFSAPVHERYGSREIGLVGMQLRPKESLAFTVDWANVYVEPATPLDADGTSEILVTKLNADAMPMIRYRVGDVGHFSKGAQPGTAALGLLEIVGRRSDHLCLPDGRWLHSVGIAHLMKDMPVREFQLVQDANYDVDVRVIPLPRFSASDEAAILRVLAGNLPGVRLTLTRVAEIPRTQANKWRPVVSAVPEAEAMGTSV